MILIVINNPLAFCSYAKPICHDGFVKLSRFFAVCGEFSGTRVTKFQVPRGTSSSAQAQSKHQYNKAHHANMHDSGTRTRRAPQGRKRQNKKRDALRNTVCSRPRGLFSSQRPQVPVFCFFSTSNIYESNNLFHRTACSMALDPSRGHSQHGRPSCVRLSSLLVCNTSRDPRPERLPNCHFSKPKKSLPCCSSR